MATLIDKALQVITGRNDNETIKTIAIKLREHYREVMDAPGRLRARRGALMPVIRQGESAQHLTSAEQTHLNGVRAQLVEVEAQLKVAEEAYEQRFLLEELKNKAQRLAQLEAMGLHRHEAIVQQHRADLEKLVKRVATLKKDEEASKAAHAKDQRERTLRIERLSAARETKAVAVNVAMKDAAQARDEAASAYATAVAEDREVPSLEEAEKKLGELESLAGREQAMLAALGNELSRAQEAASLADKEAQKQIDALRAEIRSLDTQEKQLSWDIGAAQMVHAAVYAAEHMPRGHRDGLSIPFFDPSRVHGGFMLGNSGSCIDEGHVLEMAKALKAGTVDDLLTELRAAGLGHLIP